MHYKVTAANALAGNSADHEASGDYSWDTSKVTTIQLDDNAKSVNGAGTLIHIQTSTGAEVLSFSPTKPYTSVAFSSSKLVKGSKYDIYYGGSSTGILDDGLYQNGTYSPGAKYASFTVSGIVTTIGR